MFLKKIAKQSPLVKRVFHFVRMRFMQYFVLELTPKHLFIDSLFVLRKHLSEGERKGRNKNAKEEINFKLLKKFSAIASTEQLKRV